MGFIAGNPIGDLFGSITGSKQAAEAAGKASELQYGASMAGVDEQRRQFDEIMKLMAPYVTAGTGALSSQQDLMGLNGPEAQQKAIAALQSSPEMQALVQQGENSMLQNASATGGLRGGNLQAALAQFRPQMLSGLINQQFSRLGGIAGMGQASAAGQASAGMNSASNIANLLQQGAAAQAGGVMAQGNAQRQQFQDIMNLGKLALSF